MKDSSVKAVRQPALSLSGFAIPNETALAKMLPYAPRHRDWLIPDRRIRLCVGPSERGEHDCYVVVRVQWIARSSKQRG